MSQPDTIWWCGVRRGETSEGCAGLQSYTPSVHHDCGWRRLVSPSALVIERDERVQMLNIDLLRGSIGAGRPPSIGELGELWEAAAIILDALAAFQSDPVKP